MTATYFPKVIYSETMSDSVMVRIQRALCASKHFAMFFSTFEMETDHNVKSIRGAKIIVNVVCNTIGNSIDSMFRMTIAYSPCQVGCEHCVKMETNTNRNGNIGASNNYQPTWLNVVYGVRLVGVRVQRRFQHQLIDSPLSVTIL